MPSATARELNIPTDDGVVLAGEEAGAGTSGVPIVLLHGLTATRRYVVMGSRLLERSGCRVIAYDARGHGRSGPAPDRSAYGYERLARDLEAVLDALQIPRAALAGASMGAHTAVRFALEHPARVAALGLVTPAFDPALDAADPDLPAAPGGTASAPEWTAASEGDRPIEDRPALARALREGGVEGFVRAYDFSTLPPAWRETVERVVRQRLSLHEHPEAVADALEVVSRSRPFEDFAELGAIAAPTIVVASRDEVDPGHPLVLAERYARAIPGATLAVEDGGVEGEPSGRRSFSSPIAWQGGQLSKVFLELLARARAPARLG